MVLTGLTDDEVLQSRQAYGSNVLRYHKHTLLKKAFKAVLGEPMVVLLLITAGIYFAGGDEANGIFMACSIVLVTMISFYQDNRSRNALEKLKHLAKPVCSVIRNGYNCKINSEDIVVGDYLLAEEGGIVGADGDIIQSGDFCINESVITGESLPVSKDAGPGNNAVYMGTAVTAGAAVIRVTAVGNSTKLGIIGKSLENISVNRSPLEKNINRFVSGLVVAGLTIFCIVWVLNYAHSHNLSDSLLKSLALAMSILPEEIPVAFTTFMAMGAYRLLSIGVIARNIKSVETLGNATVICVDKTGTITENRMALAGVFTSQLKFIISDQPLVLSEAEKDLIRIAMFASEPISFDPMEIALHHAYSESFNEDERPAFTKVYEYPLEGKPPMMTHIFENSEGCRVIAAKGAPEAIIIACRLEGGCKSTVEEAVNTFAATGYRVLGVAEAVFKGTGFPQDQRMFLFNFKGLVAFYDPPKPSINEVLKRFYNAGVKVKIITGDNRITTAAIARQIGLQDAGKELEGSVVMAMNDRDLHKAVNDIAVFTRMFPEAKLKVIETLKCSGEVVAMTGDGVNDAPALKAADIGVAMGLRGTDIAKVAAGLVLADDDLSKMADAIAVGRRISANLKKAIRYIISIHIPIVLVVFVPLAFGWAYPNIFTPVHVIFMELVMGPTCSIIYENEPMEKNAMLQPPSRYISKLFRPGELLTSTLQGLVITAAVLGIYQYAVGVGSTEEQTRLLVFITLVTANIFLTLVNRSFYYSLLHTFSFKNSLVFFMIGTTIAITLLLLYIKPLTLFFGFQPVPLTRNLTAIFAGFAGVTWIEVVKWYKRCTIRQCKK